MNPSVNTKIVFILSLPARTSERGYVIGAGVHLYIIYIYSESEAKLTNRRHSLKFKNVYIYICLECGLVVRTECDDAGKHSVERVRYIINN